jgi:hypothetical protein
MGNKTIKETVDELAEKLRDEDSKKLLMFLLNDGYVKPTTPDKMAEKLKMPLKKVERILEEFNKMGLIEMIDIHRKEEENPPLSDEEFDKLIDEVKELSRKHSEEIRKLVVVEKRNHDDGVILVMAYFDCLASMVFGQSNRKDVFHAMEKFSKEVMMVNKKRKVGAERSSKKEGV